MANHPSAEKRNRQRLERTAHNRSIRSALRTAVKKARTALAGGDIDVARQRVLEASKALFRAASSGVIHSNTASRGVSRIQSALHKLSG